MKSFMLLVILLSALSLSFGNNFEEEKASQRVKKHSGHYGGRPTYGGYQNIGNYQQQPQQPYYSNQRLDSGNTDGYQRTGTNFNQGFGNMRQPNYQQQQQPGQNFYQQSAPGYPGYNGNMRQYQYDYSQMG